MPLSSFDPPLLPDGRRVPSSPEFAIAINEYLTEKPQRLGGEARIVVGPEVIEVDWLRKSTRTPGQKA